MANTPKGPQRGNQAAFSRGFAELPAQDTQRGRSELAPLFALIPNLVPPAPAPPLDAKRTKLEHLEHLERELCFLLADSAPVTWREMRRTLWRLIRRARRELRAAERAVTT